MRSKDVNFISDDSYMKLIFLVIVPLTVTIQQ